MTTLFERMKEQFLADIQSIGQQKGEPNPVSQFDRNLRSAEKELKKLVAIIERQHLLKQEIKENYEEALKMAEKRKAQSVIAAQANEYELEKLALEEMQRYTEQANRLKNHYQETEQQINKLETDYRQAQLKIKDMQIKRLELMGQENILLFEKEKRAVEQKLEAPISLSNVKDLEKHLVTESHSIEKEYEKSMLDYRIAQLEKQAREEEAVNKQG
ncbi:MAG TPA: hypothetical protein VEY51_09125 [Chondromyces sp.]|nr:hypothetical protein [Chondromyces sp.]